MNVLQIIDTINANTNVGRLRIRLDSSCHKWNDELVTLIINRYTNLYTIELDDWNDYVDHMMHGWIKQYV